MLASPYADVLFSSYLLSWPIHLSHQLVLHANQDFSVWVGVLDSPTGFFTNCLLKCSTSQAWRFLDCTYTHGARKQRLLNTRADQVPYCRALPWSDGPPSSKGVARLPAQDGGGGELGAGGGDVHLPPGVLVDSCLPVLGLPWPLPKSTSSLEVRSPFPILQNNSLQNASLSTEDFEVQRGISIPFSSIEAYVTFSSLRLKGLQGLI